MKNDVIFEEITNKIVSSLEKGIVPWRKNWGFVEPAQNYFSGHKYRGVNSLLMFAEDYKTPYFATFKQISEAGGKVKKGSKATKVYFSKNLYYDKDNNILNPELYSAAKMDGAKKIWFLKYDNVFNMQDVEGLEIREAATIWNETEQIYECEEFLNRLTDKPKIEIKLSDRAFYRKSDDYLQMPFINQFESEQDFYAVLFHELVHSTGHEKRLKRETLNEVVKFGDYNYSREELVAEIGSCFLCNGFGISTYQIEENSLAYIGGWLKKLKDDKRMIFEAAAEAQKAFIFLIDQVNEQNFLLKNL